LRQRWNIERLSDLAQLVLGNGPGAAEGAVRIPDHAESALPPERQFEDGAGRGRIALREIIEGRGKWHGQQHLEPRFRCGLGRVGWICRFHETTLSAMNAPAKALAFGGSKA